MNPIRPFPILLAAALFLGTWAIPMPEAQAAAAYQKTLLRLHNKEREKRNRRPLKLHASLNRAASRYAVTMNRSKHFSHTGPDGSTFAQRILDAGGGNFRTMAENIAMGQRSPAEVTRAWIQSPGHRRNILNPHFRFVGFGKAGNPIYWAASFGG